MRTEQLQYVSAVARLGSFRRAAEELDISQPALSASVRKLERELQVTILERGRAGARVSRAGHALLPHIEAAIDAADVLREAADGQHLSSRMIRLGTVNAATVPVLVPTITAFRARYRSTQVEVVGAQEDAINLGLREGNFDLGLITCLAGDDMPPELETTRLLSGRAVVCMLPGSRLAAFDAIAPEQLLAEPLIVMRAGYLMHRLVNRVLHDRVPSVSYSTDGAEMGKLMVAEGLGATVLPDFSVIGDPLERRSVITWRPLLGDHPDVQLAIRRRRVDTYAKAAMDLHDLFAEQARIYARSRPGREARAMPTSPV